MQATTFLVLGNVIAGVAISTVLRLTLAIWATLRGYRAGNAESFRVVHSLTVTRTPKRPTAETGGLSVRELSQGQ